MAVIEAVEEAVSRCVSAISMCDLFFISCAVIAFAYAV